MLISLMAFDKEIPFDWFTFGSTEMKIQYLINSKTVFVMAFLKLEI